MDKSEKGEAHILGDMHDAKGDLQHGVPCMLDVPNVALVRKHDHDACCLCVPEDVSYICDAVPVQELHSKKGLLCKAAIHLSS
jgi:hypothetical protein